MFSGCQGVLKIPPIGIIIRHIGGNFNINLIFFKFISNSFRLNQRIEFTSTWNIQRLYRYRRYGNNFEIYFEEDDFDSFVDNLKNYDI